MTLVRWWFVFFYATGCHSRIYKHVSSWTGYEFHTYPHPAKKTVIPRDTMVDAINNLGLKLLAIHNEYNENNIAISPYGALSVLVALGEGLEGDAAYEIKQAAHLPNDISTIRVGLRDIHRHLKSYFIPKEGFLAGLTLNHENVTLRPEYEEILKFYGYDIVSFNNALFPPPETTEKPDTTTNGVIHPEQPTETTSTTEVGSTESQKQPTTETTTLVTTESSTATVTTETTTLPEITTNEVTTEKTATTLDVSTMTTLPQNGGTQVTALEPKTAEMTSPSVPTTTEVATPMTTSTQQVTPPNPTTTEGNTSPTDINLPSETTEEVSRTTRDVPTTVVTTTESPTTTVGTPQTSFTTVTEDTTTESTTQNLLTTPPETTTNLPSTTFAASTQTMFTTLLPVTSTLTPTSSASTETSTIGSTDNDISTLPTTSTVTSDTTDDSPVIEPISSALSSTTTTELIEITTEISTTDSKINEIVTDASMENVGFAGGKRSARAGETSKLNNVVELNKKEDMLYERGPKRSSRSVVDYIIARYYDDHYPMDQRYQRPYIPKEELSFLIYGKYREYNINFMKYDTVLPFYYVPHLDTLALSFPLDSTKYYLLLLLPVDETGIDKLVCDLRLNGSLKYIIANLRYTHVIATIPSFMLKGYVTLTPSFQKLGVRKVFEPRQADFTPMTNQSQIYVTNIEQAITVTIRNYVDPETMHNYRDLHQYGPVHFKADHPFLYFVIDTELHVTLMAGKIVNPLNSRIS